MTTERDLSFRSISKALQAHLQQFWIGAAIVIFAAVSVSLALRLKPVTTLPPRLIAVAFSANSERLAAGLHNGTVQVWQTKSWHSFNGFMLRTVA